MMIFTQSTRGLAILALLTIVCSLATVGVPAWPLYEGGYFLEIPAAQTSMNMTTSIAVTATPLPVADAQRNIGLVDAVNPDATVTDGTSIDRNRRATNETTSMNATTASSNSTSNGTMDAGGSNMTSPNMTAPANETTTTNAPASSNSTSNETMDTGGANMTSSNMTSDTMPSSNMTSDNSTDAVSTTPDGNSTVNTSGSTSIMTTKEDTPGTTEYYTTSNSTWNATAYALTREPIDYDEWLLIMAPFGIISIFAFTFIFFCLFIFCIACCCPERSEVRNCFIVFPQYFFLSFPHVWGLILFPAI